MDKQIVTEEELETKFKTVKESCFPNWDKEGRWKVKLTDGESRCYRDKPLIEINWSRWGPEVEVWLVHEICHALTRGDGHGIKWQEEMCRISDIINDELLKQMIRDDVEEYKKRKTNSGKEYSENWDEKRA